MSISKKFYTSFITVVRWATCLTFSLYKKKLLKRLTLSQLVIVEQKEECVLYNWELLKTNVGRIRGEISCSTTENY